MGQLNIELFKKIRDRIAALPNAYDQDSYYRKELSVPCGTACCIAGEAVICAAPTVEQGVEKLRELNLRSNVPEAAGRLLGLLNEDEHYDLKPSNSPPRRLFSDAPQYHWPEPFSSQWQKARSRKARAAVAVAYLDHIISTGKVLE